MPPESWLSRNWRPIVMLVFSLIILHTFLIGPIFGLGTATIPPDMWDLLQLGMGGFIVTRSIEKVIKK